MMTSSSTAKLPAPDTADGSGKKLWIYGVKKEWTNAMYTPFMVSLAAGNLKLETFREFISQDALFLRAFKKAYEMAEECADDDEKNGIKELRKSVDKVLELHKSYGKEWGVDVTTWVATTAATVKYTDFLLATASGKVDGVKVLLTTPFEKTKLAAYTISVIAPCMRLYAILGKEMQTLVGPIVGIHPYQKWIDNYSSDAFQTLALQVEDLLEKLNVSFTGEELHIIGKLYLEGMKLQVEFFRAQPVVQKTAVPLSRGHNPAKNCLMIFSSFDLTCIVLDSSAILAKLAMIAIIRAEKNQSENEIARMSSDDLLNKWNEITNLYAEEYDQCIDNILLCDKEEFMNYEGLRRAVARVSDFQAKANLRVTESGVLKGLNENEIKRAGGYLKLEAGCANLFRSAVENENLNINIHIISYCWCADLIRSAFSSAGLEDVKINANEFIYKDSLSTGDIVTMIQSPIDKVEAYNAIVESKFSNDKRMLTVYIGDSVRDLLCLLKSDVGIVLGSSRSLRRVGLHFGARFVPLYAGSVDIQKQMSEESTRTHWSGLSGILYTASSWTEIHSFILGL